MKKINYLEGVRGLAAFLVFLHHFLLAFYPSHYSVFNQSKIPIYFKSDTHWNMNGFNLWLNEFNKALVRKNLTE